MIVENPKATSSVGIICEFNPLHNGHVYLMSEARKLAGDDGCVVCVMSGRSTQRGELAITDPYTRARMALEGGADLVVELPYPWSSGSSEAFALAGVHILASLGVEHLLFGSECGDLSLLEQGAEIINSADFSETYASACRKGKGTAAAFAEALAEVGSRKHFDLPAGFPDSNDLLGLAYLAAVAKEKTDAITPHTVKRLGQSYRDELLTDADYPSATAIRTIICEAYSDMTALSAMLDGTMPRAALDHLLTGIDSGLAPVSTEPLWTLAHALFRLKEDRPTKLTAELGGGLYSHIRKCALTTADAAQFMKVIETKQYTKARLRRCLLFAVTGVLDEDLDATPKYTQLLATNQNGRRFLAALRKTGKEDAIPVITKPAHAPEGRQRELNERIDALVTLCMPTPQDAGYFMRRGVVVKDFG